MNPESLGGYRILRKLGEGERADVFLAHPMRDQPDAVPVALKIYRDECDDTAVLAEASALSRAAGEHVVELLDVASGHDGRPLLVLRRLAGGTVGNLLRDRHHVSLGEAITILAPVVSVISRLHDVGVVHGGIRAQAVLFDSSGTPVLACFGRAVLVEPGLPPARRDAEPGIEADARALAALACRVLASVGTAASTIEWIESTVDARPDDWLAQLLDRLFALGSPEPVRLGSPRGLHGEVHSVVPARLGTGQPAHGREETVHAVPPWIEGLLPPAVADTARRYAARVRATAATVRRPAWLVAGGVAVALFAAMIMIPPSDSGAASVPTAESTTPPTPGDSVVEEDPAVALVELLEVREQCIRDMSVLCLDGVAQPGSAALAADQQLVRGVQGGAEAPPRLDYDTLEVTLVEQLGGSAILDLAGGWESGPASVLLMKGEAGWRIRDYLG